MRKKEKTRILSQKELCESIWDMTLLAPRAAAEARPGMFVNIFLNDAGKLLPRPVSLCGIDREAGVLRLVYRAAGAGTRELAAMSEGEELEILGPLGNGFPLEEAEGKRVFLIGGGVGIPPLLETAGALSAGPVKAREIVSVMGYRNADTFLAEEFEACGSLLLATEDGSRGTKGNVLDAMKADGREAEVIFACGPLPMLRALKAYAAERQIPCWLSMEERMACGIGACLACVCKTSETDSHSNVRNARVCKDGPVFEAGVLDL